MNNKQPSKLATIAILSLYMLTMANATINGSLMSIMMAFPQTAPSRVLQLMTIGTIFGIPANLFAGWALGKKMKYRTAAIIGSALIVIGYIGPAFLHSSVEQMLVLRAIAGIGSGLTLPLGSALVMGLFPPEKSATIMGIGTAVTNVSGMIMSYVAGLLTTKDWTLSFWASSLVIITLVLSFCIPEPPKFDMPPASDAEKKPEAAVKLNPFTWVVVITFGLMGLFCNSVFINISVIMANKGIGGAAEASLATSMFMLAGMIIGFANGKLFEALKGKTIALGLFLQALAMVCVHFGNSTILAYIAMFLLGFGYSGAMITLMMLTGMKNHPSKTALAVSLNLTVINLVTFIITGYIGVLDKIMPVEYNYVLVAMIGFIIMTVLYFIFDPLKAPKKEA